MHLILIPIILILLIYIQVIKKKCNTLKYHTIVLNDEKIGLTRLTTPALKSSPTLLVGISNEST